MARPRCEVNQRLTTVAPSVMAATPVPPPTITPHSSTICHGACIIAESAVPATSTASAPSTVGRMPKYCIDAAANGPVSPYSAIPIEMASEIVLRLQPNSCSSGSIITLGVARVPAAHSRIRNTTASASQL